MGKITGDLAPGGPNPWRGGGRGEGKGVGKITGDLAPGGPNPWRGGGRGEGRGVGKITGDLAPGGPNPWRGGGRGEIPATTEETFLLDKTEPGIKKLQPFYVQFLRTY